MPHLRQRVVRGFPGMRFQESKRDMASSSSLDFAWPSSGEPAYSNQSSISLLAESAESAAWTKL